MIILISCYSISFALSTILSYRYERDRTYRDDRSYRDERSLRDDRSYNDESMMGQSYRRHGGGRNYDDRYDRRDESR